jgi:hypothetical protein
MISTTLIRIIAGIGIVVIAAILVMRRKNKAA